MSTRDDIPRHYLPIPDPQRTGLITYDAKDPDTKFPKIDQLLPPKGAPNVLVILIDDVGFGASSAFGGPCQTPNASPDYKSSESAFNGRVRGVQIAVAEAADAAGHMVSPEEALRVAMARQ